MLIESIILFSMIKKYNKYICLFLMLLLSYFLLFHQSNLLEVNNLYSSLNSAQLMPQIIDKVPF